MLASIDCLFSFSLRSSWFLVWWVIFDKNLDISALWHWILFKSSVLAGFLDINPAGEEETSLHYCYIKEVCFSTWPPLTPKVGRFLISSGWGRGSCFCHSSVVGLPLMIPNSPQERRGEVPHYCWVGCNSRLPICCHWHHRWVGLIKGFWGLKSWLPIWPFGVLDVSWSCEGGSLGSLLTFAGMHGVGPGFCFFSVWYFSKSFLSC